MHTNKHIPLFHMCMLSGYIHKGKKQMLQQILYWVDVERPELHSFLLWKGVFHVTSFHCEYFCALWHFILSELSFAPNWQDEAYLALEQKRDSVSHLKLLQSYFLFTQVSTLSPQIPRLDLRCLFTWLESVRLQNKVERYLVKLWKDFRAKAFEPVEHGEVALLGNRHLQLQIFCKEHSSSPTEVLDDAVYVLLQFCFTD